MTNTDDTINTNNIPDANNTVNYDATYMCTDAILLTPALLQTQDLYYHCGFCALVGCTAFVTTRAEAISIKYDWNTAHFQPNELPLGGTIQTITNAWLNRLTILEEDTFIVDMPFSVWNTFFSKIQGLTLSKRKIYTRVFCYLYYWAMRFNGTFVRSREIISKELRMSNKRFSEAAIWLEDNGLMRRSGYLVANSNRQARGYSFDADLWNDAARNNHFYA